MNFVGGSGCLYLHICGGDILDTAKGDIEADGDTLRSDGLSPFPAGLATERRSGFKKKLLITESL